MMNIEGNKKMTDAIDVAVGEDVVFQVYLYGEWLNVSKKVYNNSSEFGFMCRIASDSSAPRPQGYASKALDMQESVQPVFQALTLNGWISVKNRLPRYIDTVLITNGFVVKTGELDVDASGNPCWFEKFAVTHWMPVPPPPRESDKS